MSTTDLKPAPITPTIGVATDGFGAGVETQRSYQAEDFPTGSQRNLAKWLTTLLDRDDVQRIWLKAIGGKEEIWSHDGTLYELPDLDHLFAVAEDAQIAA